MGLEAFNSLVKNARKKIGKPTYVRTEISGPRASRIRGFNKRIREVEVATRRADPR